MPNLEPLLKRLRSIAAQGDWKPLTQLTDEIAAALARPMNYNDVEDIENLLIRSWVKILASPHTASWEARLATGASTVEVFNVPAGEIVP